jgi:hypothetical protein
MIDLNKEAEELINSRYPDFSDLDNGNIWVNIENLMVDFTKQEVVKAKIDFITNEMVAINWDIRKIYVEELQEQLKKLQDE